MDENMVAAEGLVVAEGMAGMVVTQAEGGGLMLVDADGMTLKLEQGVTDPGKLSIYTMYLAFGSGFVCSSLYL